MKRTLFALALFLCSRSLPAQVFMRAFDNAANLALGGATVAATTPSNGMMNPAQLGRSPQWGVFAWSALPYAIQGWQSHGFQAMARVQKRSGISAEVLHSGIEGYAEQRFQLSYGRQMGEKWSLGGSFQTMRVSAGEYGNQTALTFALGILAKPLPTLSIGAAVENPIPQQINDQSMANRLRIGAQWAPSDLFRISTEVSKSLDRPLQIHSGVEYRPVSLVFIRAGARTAPARTGLGAGLALKNGLRLDFGTEWHSILGWTPAAMVVWQKG